MLSFIVGKSTNQLQEVQKSVLAKQAAERERLKAAIEKERQRRQEAETAKAEAQTKKEADQRKEMADQATLIRQLQKENLELRQSKAQL